MNIAWLGPAGIGKDRTLCQRMVSVLTRTVTQYAQMPRYIGSPSPPSTRSRGDDIGGDGGGGKNYTKKAACQVGDLRVIGGDPRGDFACFDILPSVPSFIPVLLANNPAV